MTFKTMTRKRFAADSFDNSFSELKKRIYSNLIQLNRLVNYCVENDIHHLRLSSSLFPLATDPKFNIFDLISKESLIVDQLLSTIGQKIKRDKITCSSHPSQFVMAMPRTDEIKNNSIRDLELAGWLHDSLGLPQDHSNPINIHPNGTAGGIETKLAVEKFIDFWGCLSESVSRRLVFENCDKGDWNCETLYDFHNLFFAKTGVKIPLCYDNLHDEVLPSNNNYLEKFKKTWSNNTPVFHWSEGGKNGKKRSHVDVPSFLPTVVSNNLDCIWELECKDKESAIKVAKSFF